MSGADESQATINGDGLASQLYASLESMPDAFILLDAGWRFMYINAQAERVLMRPRAELLGRNMWDEFPEGVDTIAYKEYAKVKANGGSTTFELDYPPLSARLEVRAFASQGGLAIYFRDISERHSTQETMRLLQSTISRLKDVVIITEAGPIGDGPPIVFVNDAFTGMTGYTPVEVLGKTLRFLHGPKTDPDELLRTRDLLARGLTARTEIINYTKDGREIWVEGELFPLVSDAGMTTHIVVVARDVTQRRELEAQLRQSQRLEAVGQLTGGVAHDFNNLLTVILSNAELLETRLEGNDQLHMLAEMTRLAAERGAELTSRLLSFSRRQALDPKATDVAALVRSMDQLLRRALGEQIHIQIVAEHGAWDALIDSLQLESALLNLCINARDAMSAGGMLSIGVWNSVLKGDATSPGGDYVVLSVADTGTGMDDATRARVFEPFFTTKEVGKGSGLGLSMVYGFVTQSKGRIEIESEVGRGTTVKLYLPRSREARREQSGEAVQVVATGRERVLLVEDDDLLRVQVGGELTNLGYRVVSARSGLEALRLLQEGERFDLLFTDVVMAGMSGEQLALLARNIVPGLPVLYTSGHPETMMDEEGYLSPGVTLLRKPYKRRELAAKLREVLGAPPRAEGAA
ncbi:MAG: PAS domain S-box protein [Alphaproteobacteria bacterium]|nr:PAS domain S-box protein [Alphaproteobacteria bacterium]